jgi:hypothetical protein
MSRWARGNALVKASEATLQTRRLALFGVNDQHLLCGGQIKLPPLKRSKLLGGQTPPFLLPKTA